MNRPPDTLPISGLAAVFRDVVAEYRRKAGTPDRWLVAVSGGLDSTVLLHLAARTLPSARLYVCHLHHGLRGIDADTDERHVAECARRAGLPFTARRTDVAAAARAARRGVEETARDLRHRLFRALSLPGGATAVLLGHHAGDQLETVLARWHRGASWRGLGGMRPAAPLPDAGTEGRTTLFRPLLGFTRAELQAYAERHGLRWREDRSNAEPVYFRNRLRLRICPRLTAAGLDGALLDWSRNAARLDRLLERFAEIWLKRHARRDGEGVTIPLPALPRAGEAESGDAPDWRGEIRVHILRRACEAWTGPTPTRIPGKTLLERLLSLAEGNRSEAMATLGRGWTAWRRGDRLRIARTENKANGPAIGNGGAGAEPPPSSDPAPAAETASTAMDNQVIFPERRGRWRLPEWGITVRIDAGPPPESWVSGWVAWMAEDAVRGPLVLRRRRPGDRFQPLGSPGSRSVKDILIDLKIPRDERERSWILADDLGIVWLAPWRLAERVRVPEGATTALRIECSEFPSEAGMS